MENTDGIMILVINNTAPGFSLPEAWEAQLWPQIIHFPRVVTVFLPQAASKPCTYCPSFSCTVDTDFLSSSLFTNPVFYILLWTHSGDISAYTSVYIILMIIIDH